VQNSKKSILLFRHYRNRTGENGDLVIEVEF